jgi:hypothetical protein
MQGVTLTFAIIACLLVTTLRPPYALAVYLTALLWYPSFLAVSVGTIDILVGRFVVAVLLVRCFFSDGIRSKFVWCRLDTLVSLSMVVYVVTFFITGTDSFEAIVESRGGFLMDTWCGYMATRFIVTDRARLISVIKCVSVALVPLAILGVIESVTFWQPFARLWVYSPWFRGGRFTSEGRFGLARAVGPFSHAILFGGVFAMFLPLVYYLRGEKKDWRPLAYILSGIALVGALSSMSSGPYVMLIAVIACLIMERHKVWVKPLVIFIVLSCIFIGIASNRPFYHVIVSWANPLGGAGWHRAKLIDLAIENFNEWWVVGYGDKDPGWGSQLGMGRTDVTNEYILNGIRYGLLGVIVLCAVLVKAFQGIITTHRKVTQPAQKSLVWAFGSLLFSVVIAWMSVSFFGQLTTLFYCCLGMIGSLCGDKFDWQTPNTIALARNYPARKAS